MRTVVASAVAGLLALLFTGLVLAEAIAVPVPLQAELMSKAATYDRNLRSRSGDVLVVLLLVRSGDGDSERTAAQMTDALNGLSTFGGMTHRTERIAFTEADDVARAIRDRHASILYLAPGLLDDVPAISAALDDVDVLSVAAVPSYVDAGIVLGFDVESARPKLLVHLGQSKRQHVDFMATFLKLAKVVDR